MNKLTFSAFILLLGMTSMSVAEETPIESQMPEETSSDENAEETLTPPSNTIYKTFDKNGQPIYTDKPQNYENAELIKVDPNQNTMQSRTPPEVLDEKIKQDIEDRKDRVASNSEKWEAKKKDLQSRFEAAKKARAEGQDTQDGDFIGYRTKTGGQACCRPSQQRLDRLKQLDENLTTVRNQLRTHLKKNPKTYKE